MTTQTQYRPFTVDEYYRMVEAKILTEEDRVELIAGDIINKRPIGSCHAACVDRLNGLFHRQLGNDFIVRVQSPIRLDDYSAPEPDLVLLKPREDFYADAHPSADDVLVVIEVGDTSATHDREVKIPLYAEANIPEVWLVDLHENRIEIYADPANGTYRQVVEVAGEATLSSPTINRLKFSAADVLG